MPVNVLSRLAVLQSKNLPLVFRGESCVVLLGFVVIEARFLHNEGTIQSEPSQCRGALLVVSRQVKCHIPVLPKRDGFVFFNY